MIVSTVGQGEAIQRAFQRELFYAKGCWWLFYQEVGGTVVKVHSCDGGVTWSAPKGALDPDPLHTFSLYFDGEYLHIISAYDSPLHYQRGKPNSDGTITWSSLQTIPSIDHAWMPAITVDSNGYPWVGYEHIPSAGIDEAVVIKSSKNDGTWQTESGFPVTLSTESVHQKCVPLALTSGKVLVIYTKEYGIIRAKLYDGGWGSEEAVSSSTVDIDEEMFSVVAYDDIVHLAFAIPYGALRKILYVKRDGSWSSEELIKGGDDSDSAIPNIAVDSKGNIYVASLWSDGLRIFKRRGTGEWSDDLIVLEKDSSGGHGTHNSVALSRIEYSSPRQIGIMLAEGTSSPYTIKFMPLTLLSSALKTTPNSGL